MAPRINPAGPKAPSLQPENPGNRTVDPYMRPPEENDLGRLSNALGRLAPTLSQFSERAKASELARGEEQGRVDFLKMKDAGFKIKAGELDASGSPWYRRAYHESVGQLAASQYGGDLQKAVSNPEGPLANSVEPADFDKFAGNQRAAWLKENFGKPNADFAAGFNASVTGIENNLRTNFIASANARLKDKTNKVYYANVQAEYGVLLKNPALSPAQRKTAWAFWINQLKSQKYFLDPKSGTHLNETTANAIFDAAKAHEDMSLLEVADMVDSGINKGAILSHTDEWLSKVDEVRVGIRNQKNNRINFESAEVKRARIQGISAIYDSIGAAFSAQGTDPNAIDTRPWIEQMTKVDSSKVEDMQGVIEAYRKGGTIIEDPAYKQELESDSFSDTLTDSDVATAIASRRISIKTGDELRRRIRANRAGAGSKAIIQDPYYLSARDDLRHLFTDEKGYKGGQLAVLAEQDLRANWLAYRQSPEGAKATSTELNAWVADNVDDSFYRIAKKGKSPRSLPKLKKDLEAAADAATKPGAPVGPQTLTPSKEIVVELPRLKALIQAHEAYGPTGIASYDDVNLQLIRRFGLTNSDGTPNPIKIDKFIVDQQKHYINN